MAKRPTKKKRPADTNMRMHSILQDVIAISSKPIKSPKGQRQVKKRNSV